MYQTLPTESPTARADDREFERLTAADAGTVVPMGKKDRRRYTKCPSFRSRIREAVRVKHIGMPFAELVN
jgi:hypothetical protein